MKRIFVALLTAILIAGCNSKAELEQEQQRSAALQAELEQERAQTSALRAQLEQSAKQLAAAQASLGSATTQLTRKPALPVTVVLERVPGETGYTVTLSTIIKQDLLLEVSLQSKAMGSKRKTLNLPQDGKTSLRYLDRVTFEPGDVVTIANAAYEPAVVQIGP